MKKKVLFGSIAAVAMLFSSCETEVGVDDGPIAEGLMGNASIVVTGNNGYYNSGDTVNFTSGITDVFVADNGYHATIAVCAHIDLMDADVVDYPFMGFQVSDTTTGIYQLDSLLTVERLMTFNADSMKALISAPSSFNFVVIACSDTSWYMTTSGSLTISQYGEMGYNTVGTINNANAFYFTQSDVDSFNAALESGADNLVLFNYLKPATINGTFSCRRAAVINRLMEEFRQ